MVAAAVVGAAVVGGVASNMAANTQASAASAAAQQSQATGQQAAGIAQAYGTNANAALSSGATAANGLLSSNQAQTRQDQNPYMQAGSTAVGQLSDLSSAGLAGSGPLSSFNASDLSANLAPNYQFQLDQGLGQASHMANATGGLVSGNTLQGLNTFAQNYAQGAYQQAFNNYQTNQQAIVSRLSGLAGTGQTSANTVDASGLASAQSGAAATTGAASGIANANLGTASTIGSDLTGATAAQTAYNTSGAAAQAAGQIGVANAASSGVGNYYGWNYLNSRSGGSGAGGGGTAPTDTGGPATTAQ